MTFFWQRKAPAARMEYSSLRHAPPPADWLDLIGRPAVFPTLWSMISDAPTTWPWTSITDKPVLFDGTWSSLTGKPTTFPAAWADITGKPVFFSGAYADLTGKPTLFDGTWASLTGKPTTWAWTDITGKPTFATVATTGAYSDLTGKPTIPVIQRTRLQTNTSGVVSWTFPVAYGGAVIPIVQVGVEIASTTDSYNVQFAVTNTGVTVKAFRTGGIVVALLGLTLLQFNASAQCYVHITAQDP